MLGPAEEIQPNRLNISSEQPAPNLQDHGNNEVIEPVDYDTKFARASWRSMGRRHQCPAGVRSGSRGRMRRDVEQLVDKLLGLDE